MSENQSSNNTIDSSSSDVLEIAIPFIARFWILLPFDVISTILSILTISYVFLNKKARSSVKNHALIVVLIFGLGVQLIDVPFYLNFLVHSGVFPPTPTTCQLWFFADFALYNGAIIISAWIAFERHIIVFHDRWLTTTKQRIILHYAPLVFLALYILIYYTYSIYFFPCENVYAYTYTLPVCNMHPCYVDDFIMSTLDSFANIIVPTFLEACFSLSFLFRVIWQKHRSRQPFQWRKQRKMTIQLMSLSSLNLFINIPIGAIQLAYIFGMLSEFGSICALYYYFFSYFVTFIIPFICFLSIVNIKKLVQERILRRWYERSIVPSRSNAF